MNKVSTGFLSASEMTDRNKYRVMKGEAMAGEILLHTRRPDSPFLHGTAPPTSLLSALRDGLAWVSEGELETLNQLDAAVESAVAADDNEAFEAVLPF